MISPDLAEFSLLIFTEAYTQTIMLLLYTYII